MDVILHEAIRIAKLAGAEIKRLREIGGYSESLKDGYELLTTADLASNDIIHAEINKLFPEHDIFSEEDEQKTHTLQHPTWIVDPIDGTVGYANGHYQVAVSIAYADNYKVRHGVVYNPFLDELFYASKGSGAFLNGNRISAKDTAELKTCVIATGFPPKKNNIHDAIVRLEQLLPHIRDIRRLGSAALDICWVACGRLQGYYEEELHAWDVAAANLIAKEAGASLGFYKGSNNPGTPECINGNHVLVASPNVFDELRMVLYI